MRTIAGGNSDVAMLKVLAERIRPLLLLPNPEMEIAALIKMYIDDSIGRSTDQTARELVRIATTAVNARKRQIARAIAEGIPE